MRNPKAKKAKIVYIPTMPTIHEDSVLVLEDNCEVAEEGDRPLLPKSHQQKLLKLGKSSFFDDEKIDKIANNQTENIIKDTTELDNKNQSENYCSFMDYIFCGYQTKNTIQNTIELDNKNQSENCCSFMDYIFCGYNTVPMKSKEDADLTNQRTEQQIQPRTTWELTKINQMELKQFAPPYRNVVSL